MRCERQGRERRYQLASPAVAEALEALARIAPSEPIRSLRAAGRSAALRQARTCYDHLAGELGVGLTEALIAGKLLLAGDGAFVLTARGERRLAELGVDVEGRAPRAARSRAHASTGASVDPTSRGHWGRRSPTRSSLASCCCAVPATGR